MTDPPESIDASSTSPSPPPTPILSICVSVKNRSRIGHEGRELTLFPDLVRCLAGVSSAMREVGPIELVVADFRSDDWPLTDWLAGAAGQLQVRLVAVEGEFSRGRGLNRAVARAASHRLFLIDADLLIRPPVLRRAIEVIDRGHAWFPICRCLDDAGRPAFWNEKAFGIAAIDRSWFVAAGGLPEFSSWGGEDDLFFARLALHVAIDRERAEGLDHQWHPLDIRFVHYARPFKSDYREHLAAAAGERPWGTPLRKLLVEHPHWAGELLLFENGRMTRPGIDAGEYTVEEGARLVLRWDRWPAVTLHWDETDRVYRHRALRITMREVPLEDPIEM